MLVSCWLLINRSLWLLPGNSLSMWAQHYYVYNLFIVNMYALAHTSFQIDWSMRKIHVTCWVLLVVDMFIVKLVFHDSRLNLKHDLWGSCYQIMMNLAWTFPIQYCMSLIQNMFFQHAEVSCFAIYICLFFSDVWLKNFFFSDLDSVTFSGTSASLCWGPLEESLSNLEKNNRVVFPRKKNEHIPWKLVVGGRSFPFRNAGHVTLWVEYGAKKMMENIMDNLGF